MEKGNNSTAQRSTAHATRTGDGDGHRGRSAGEKGTGTRGVRMVCLCGVSETALRFRTQLRFHTQPMRPAGCWRAGNGPVVRRFGGSADWTEVRRAGQTTCGQISLGPKFAPLWSR